MWKKKKNISINTFSTLQKQYKITSNFIFPHLLLKNKTQKNIHVTKFSTFIVEKTKNICI